MSPPEFFPPASASRFSPGDHRSPPRSRHAVWRSTSTWPALPPRPPTHRPLPWPTHRGLRRSPSPTVWLPWPSQPLAGLSRSWPPAPAPPVPWPSRPRMPVGAGRLLPTGTRQRACPPRAAPVLTDDVPVGGCSAAAVATNTASPDAVLPFGGVGRPPGLYIDTARDALPPVRFHPSPSPLPAWIAIRHVSAARLQAAARGLLVCRRVREVRDLQLQLLQVALRCATDLDLIRCVGELENINMMKNEEMKCKFKMSHLEEVLCLSLAIHMVIMDMRRCAKEEALPWWTMGEQSTWWSWLCEDAPKKKLSHGGLWGSNPQDFVKQTQARKAFHLVEVKIVVIKLKWNAQGSTVPPTMEPNMSRGDKDEDEYEEEDWVVSLRDKGKSVFKYADDVASLKNELEEEQTIKEALEDTFALELSREKENHDRALEMANELKLKNDKLVFVNAKLLEDFEQLKKGSRVIESALTKLTESHEQLKASYLKEHANLPSPIAIDNDACATNSTSCEASILKENVELRAQLELLTCNYGKLEENHGKLSSSHEDLLASHDRLKLAHEAIISKATPCEPHVDTSTTTQNAILPCASTSNSSTHNIAKSCDELSSLPCCSNNEDSTSSSTCVVTNHVEEIKELKAQVTSLKNDLVKGHEGKCKLDTMLSMQQSPNDKSGLGFKSNNKNKSKNNNKKKGQVQVKDPAKIVCFKCNIEGHHVRSCPLKKKQKGKRPQAQTHIQPQVEEIPLPKKKQANAPIVEKPSEKKEKKRTCYICREKGHISSLCTIGTSSNSITIDDVYSLRKDEGGNVFAKYVGAQSGVKKRTIWVAKPIVTNLLGPNLVGDQHSKI
ncbi:hypothetical protein QYE76_055419 [Lolium multiflorum]|uniref:CCHC-type domain-containing protein n=1 Tax=Lolium multiflorum TaxID=4521 RepID=A0AAD8T119_LOLMU|nr:hypothetical protein QYE76_055419 [Lolium multiflorum]